MPEREATNSLAKEAEIKRKTKLEANTGWNPQSSRRPVARFAMTTSLIGQQAKHDPPSESQ